MRRHRLYHSHVPYLTRRRSIPVSSDIASLQEDLSDILSSAADLSNKLVAKVISYRSEQLAQLDLPTFLVFFNQSWDFVIKCEVICRRMIMGLRGTILGQVGLSIHSLPYHDGRSFRPNYSCKFSISQESINLLSWWRMNNGPKWMSHTQSSMPLMCWSIPPSGILPTSS